MNRLTFLKTIGLVAAVPLGKWIPVGPLPAEAGEGLPECQFRGMPKGRIEVSRNAGRDWEPHTNLGEGYRIQGFTYRTGRVQARVMHDGRPFALHLSPNGRHWLTCARPVQAG